MVRILVTSGAPALSRRQLLERYSHLRDDHLRYMQKWGLIRPSHRAHGETFYGFPDLTVVREADADLANGATFRAVLRNLLASHRGQLTLDFRIEAQPAKVLQLRRPEPPPMAVLMDTLPIDRSSSSEQYFAAASILDDGDPANFDSAAAAYRRALEIDPYLGGRRSSTWPTFTTRATRSPRRRRSTSGRSRWRATSSSRTSTSATFFTTSGATSRRSAATARRFG